MRLYVARHGEAGAYVTNPTLERARALTVAGRKGVEKVARALAANGEKPDIIIASPFSRTLETADILGHVLGVGVTTDENLQPDRDLVPYLYELLDDKGQRRVMLVGHHDNLYPMLKKFSEKGEKVDELRKGEVRRLKVDRKDGEWKERFRIAPEDLGV